MKQRVAIVIPIIAPSVKGDELQSLRQCLNTLGKRDIYYLCSNELDTTFYERLNNEAGVPFRKRTFGGEWFNGVNAYNRLCFSSMLYEAFAEYEYMLIYQLDAYVFEDRLDEWCQRGYDYVGGPWLCHWSREVENLDHWEVGNGGFSLRKVDTFLRVLTSPRLLRKPLKGTGRLAKENRKRLNSNPLLIVWMAFRALTGYHKHAELPHQPQLPGGQSLRAVQVQPPDANPDGQGGAGVQLRHAAGHLLQNERQPPADGLPHVVQI